MKLATKRWNVRITIDGKEGVPFYYGFKTKKEAQAEADRWLAKGYEAKAVKLPKDYSTKIASLTYIEIAEHRKKL